MPPRFDDETSEILNERQRRIIWRWFDFGLRSVECHRQMYESLKYNKELEEEEEEGVLNRKDCGGGGARGARGGGRGLLSQQ